MIERVLPHSIENEQSVLGAIMFRPDVILDICDIISPQDFYRDAHRRIYRSMLTLMSDNVPIDPMTVCTALSKQGDLERVGGMVYVSELVEMVHTTQFAPEYAKAVAEAARKRRGIEASHEAIERLYDPTSDTTEVVSQLEYKLGNLSENKGGAYDPTALIGIAADRAEHWQGVAEGTKEPGMRVGFSALDYTLGGVESGDLVIIAARPSVGKTAFACNITRNILNDDPKASVAWISCEMTTGQLVDRWISDVAGINLRALKYIQADGKDAKPEINRIHEAVEKTINTAWSNRLFIDDKPGPVSQCAAQIKRIKAKNPGLKAVFADHLQIMDADDMRETRNNQLGQITKRLKRLAKELDIAVFACCQLSRAGSDVPNLIHLRDSGNIEQDADKVVFLHAPKSDDKGQQGHLTDTKVIVAKNRNGATGMVPFWHEKRFTRFTEV